MKSCLLNSAAVYLEGNPLSKCDITRYSEMVQLQHVRYAIKPLKKLFHLNRKEQNQIMYQLIREISPHPFPNQKHCSYNVMYLHQIISTLPTLLGGTLNLTPTPMITYFCEVGVS